jgi:hypothetical protein
MPKNGCKPGATNTVPCINNIGLGQETQVCSPYCAWMGFGPCQ